MDKCVLLSLLQTCLMKMHQCSSYTTKFRPAMTSSQGLYTDIYNYEAAGKVGT
jgi:hypothetical protein